MFHHLELRVAGVICQAIGRIVAITLFLPVYTRRTQGLEIPPLKHISRWIVLTLKWSAVSIWLQANTPRLVQLENIARASNIHDEWKNKIENEPNLKGKVRNFEIAVKKINDFR
jgi:hypothetical protein